MNPITIYKTIESENLSKFNERCNELSKEGWIPLFGITVCMNQVGGDSLVKYTQQWMKVELPSQKPS